MQQGEPPRDRQPQTDTLCGPSLAEACHKRLEDPFLQLERDACARVAHPQMQMRRGNLRAAERIASADMAIQDRMRLADAFNLDRKQDFLSLLADVHDLLAPARAG